MNPIMIARPISGISLNGIEYVLDSSGERPILFKDEEEARKYLKTFGYTDEQIEAEGILFINRTKKDAFIALFTDKEN